MTRDKIIEQVINKIKSRSDVGFKKYGVTLKDDNQPLDVWLTHIQEELMDAVNYIERAREEIKRQDKNRVYIDISDIPAYPVTDTNFKDDCGFAACNCTDQCIKFEYDPKNHHM
mgnify:CR=1 FL=1